MFERLSDEVVLIDGKHYRLMTDAECADFIWGTPLMKFERKCEAQDWYWPWSDATNADDGSQKRLLTEARQLGPEYVAVYERYRIANKNLYYKA